MTITRLHPPTNAEKFGAVGHLYDLIGKENAVRVSEGIGTLIQVRDEECQVLLMRQKPTGRGANGTPYTPMRVFPTQEVSEA